MKRGALVGHPLAAWSLLWCLGSPGRTLVVNGGPGGSLAPWPPQPAGPEVLPAAWLEQPPQPSPPSGAWPPSAGLPPTGREIGLLQQLSDLLGQSPRAPPPNGLPPGPAAPAIPTQALPPQLQQIGDSRQAPPSPQSLLRSQQEGQLEQLQELQTQQLEQLQHLQQEQQRALKFPQPPHGIQDRPSDPLPLTRVLQPSGLQTVQPLQLPPTTPLPDGEPSVRRPPPQASGSQPSNGGLPFEPQPPQQSNEGDPTAAQNLAAAGVDGACLCLPEQEQCRVSKLTVRQDHPGQGLSFADVTSTYGGGQLNQEQFGAVTLAPVASTSFMCLDDRVTEPALVTPGGDLGEFILALGSYWQEQHAASGSRPTQKVVDAMFAEYLNTIPASRPIVFCTDERAMRHLEAELPAASINLLDPAEHLKEIGLLSRLTEVENHGDSHVRLMLQQPEWYQLDEFLVPMVVRSFYTSLWKQGQDTNSPLFKVPKLALRILAGDANPQAFLEVASSGDCRGSGAAPMLRPRTEGRSVLLSHLDAVSLRRAELAHFFARFANTTPRKVDAERLHKRLDRHGWLALETTGSRMAAGLPFYTLTYS